MSSYFYSAFFKLWDAGIKDDFTELAQANPTYDLYITGHSLGIWRFMKHRCIGSVRHLETFEMGASDENPIEAFQADGYLIVS